MVLVGTCYAPAVRATGHNICCCLHSHSYKLLCVFFLSRYKVIDYGLADFEARYAAGMIGDAAEHGTQSAPKEETFRQRKQREREAEQNPGSYARRTLALRKNVIPSVSITFSTSRTLGIICCLPAKFTAGKSHFESKHPFNRSRVFEL